jgi:ADP-heptose:LPS heptosyltransferase
VVVASFNYAFEAGGWTFAMGNRYVLSDSIFRRIAEDMDKQKMANSVRTWSCFNSYERRYGGQDLNGRRLAIYRENGFGDNLIVSGLVGYLKTTYPGALIDVYAMPRVSAVWHGNTDASFHPMAPPFDALKNAHDYHLLFEGMIENDCERDQGNAYDNLFAFAGIYPKSVPANFKRPQVFWTPEDEGAEADWLKLHPSEPYVVWHWNPSGLVRQYPFELARRAIELLAEHFAVVVIGSTEGEIEGLGMTHARVFDWLNRTPTIRSFLPMLKHASAIVCGDSCVLHLAPCFPDVPTVALFGPFAHSDRSTYYRNVTPIDEMAVCPSAPCRVQQSSLPAHRCAQATGYVEGTKFCTALAALSPERIVETVLKLTK